jgi:hypothetical protein
MKSIILGSFLQAFAIVFLPLIALVLIFRSRLKSKRAKVKSITDRIFSYLRNSEKVVLDKVFIDCKAQNALSFNKDRTQLLRVVYDDFKKNITYKLPRYEKVYSPRDIISAEIMSDKQTITSFTGSQVSTWFDGVSTSVEDVKELTIKIVFNDDESPLHILTLYAPPYFVTDYNRAHGNKKPLKLAKAVTGELGSFLDLMIKKGNGEEGKEVFIEDNISEKVDNNLEIKQIPNSAQTKDNLFERLKEITDLKKEGLITEEEFLALKKDLFNKTI